MNFDKLVMRDVFLKNILQSMERNKDIFFVTADFGSPVLDDIRAKYPDRFLNVGIAEQNLINISFKQIGLFTLFLRSLRFTS